MNRKLNPLLLHRLKAFCDEHRLDHQEIDDSLTYWENMDHLQTLVTDTDLDMRMVKAAELQFQQYYRDHILWYYINAVEMGETTSPDVGPPVNAVFSLAAYAQRRATSTTP